jgi:isopenicillin N synthase-like dioxygenase
MQDIPSIDVADSDSSTLRQIDAACRDIGFMIIRGHGIPARTIANVRTAVIDYFARPGCFPPCTAPGPTWRRR